MKNVSSATIQLNTVQFWCHNVDMDIYSTDDEVEKYLLEERRKLNTYGSKAFDWTECSSCNQ